MSNDTDQPTAKSDDFEKRHGEALGVKKFAKIQAAYTVVPLATMAAGAAAGYYLLARPVAKLLPKLSKAAGVTEVALGKLSSSLGNFLSEKQNIGDVFKEFKPTPEQIEKLREIWGENSTFTNKHDQLKKSVEILNIALPAVPKSFRFGSAIGGGALGSMAGGVAIHYDKWRKEESARLAAQEINRDIANLELFKPSNPELIAENKRLSAMVAALPTIDAATAQPQGRIEEKQQSASK